MSDMPDEISAWTTNEFAPLGQSPSTGRWRSSKPGWVDSAGEPTSYIRADLVAERDAEIERLRAENTMALAEIGVLREALAERDDEIANLRGDPQ
jgi:hypothetical protein